MTDSTVTTPEAPKKSKKKLLAIISAVLVLVLGTNHLFFKVGYTTVDVTVSDSAITTVIAPVAPVADTTKADTTKK